jgi:small nuclear ribonucleoprotein (snRNP)-like protein
MWEWLLGPSYPTLKRVIVNTKTGRAFRGLLWERKGQYLVLREAELLKGRNETAPMDGEVAIDGANVDFLQVVG